MEEGLEDLAPQQDWSHLGKRLRRLSQKVSDVW